MSQMLNMTSCETPLGVELVVTINAADVPVRRLLALGEGECEGLAVGGAICIRG